jgi:hypothetical protein
VGRKPRPWLPELELLPHICVNTAARVGRWEVRPEPAGVLAVHAGLLRTGKVVFFGGSENVESQHNAGGAGIDNTRLWDPAAGNVQTVPSPANHDLFCCGHALLPDGRLLAAGGTEVWAGVPVGGDPHGHALFGHFRGRAAATTFDPGFGAGSNPWSSVKRKNFQRGTGQGGGRYPTLVTLPDGRVLAMSGHPEDSDTRHNNVTIEAFSPTPAPQGTWSDEGDQPLVLDSYPRLHVVPGSAQGKVLYTTLTDGQSWTWDPAAKVWASQPEAVDPLASRTRRHLHECRAGPTPHAESWPRLTDALLDTTPTRSIPQVEHPSGEAATPTLPLAPAVPRDAR